MSSGISAERVSSTPRDGCPHCPYQGKLFALRDLTFFLRQLERGTMLRQFFFGGGVTLINITIHALIMTTVVRVAQAGGERRVEHASLFLIAVMIPTVSVLMITHVMEVFVWALAYWMVDAAPADANLIYFAFVNYATLGYGDITPVKSWLLLGPITAMNGALLFGWSTAIIFDVLRRALVRIGLSDK
jgi:hypothetical protein